MPTARVAWSCASSPTEQDWSLLLQYGPTTHGLLPLWALSLSSSPHPPVLLQPLAEAPGAPKSWLIQLLACRPLLLPCGVHTCTCREHDHAGGSQESNLHRAGNRLCWSSTGLSDKLLLTFTFNQPFLPLYFLQLFFSNRPWLFPFPFKNLPFV